MSSNMNFVREVDGRSPVWPLWSRHLFQNVSVKPVYKIAVMAFSRGNFWIYNGAEVYWSEFMRHFSIAAILLVFANMASPALADDRDEAVAALQACRSIAANQVRLACMDAAIELLDSIETPAEITPAPAPPPASPPPIAQAAPTAESEALERERLELAAEREALARERAELAAAETEKLAAEREALAKERAALETAQKEADEPKKRGGLLSAPRGLGLFDQDDRPDRFYTNVTRIIVNASGRHFFTTEDGTIWKQVPPKPLKAPSSLPADVTIRRSASGSRRLAFEEHPRTSYVVVESRAE